MWVKTYCYCRPFWPTPGQRFGSQIYPQLHESGLSGPSIADVRSQQRCQHLCYNYYRLHRKLPGEKTHSFRINRKKSNEAEMFRGWIYSPELCSTGLIILQTEAQWTGLIGILKLKFPVNISIYVYVAGFRKCFWVSHVLPAYKTVPSQVGTHPGTDRVSTGLGRCWI